MNGARFIRFYPSDWRSGCLGLTLEQSGLYIAICAHYWETAERLPLDDATAARRLGLNCKNYRKVRNELLSLGKIARHEDGYCNDRAERELAAAKRASKTEVETDVDTPRGIHAGEHENGGDQVQKRGARKNTIDGSIADQLPNQSPINCPIEVEKTQQNQDPSKDLILEPYLKEGQSVKNKTVSVCELTDGPDPAFEKCKLALNGSTTRVVDAVRNSMGVYGTKAAAVEWVATALDDFGSDALVDAFRFFEKVTAKGEPVRDLCAFLSKNARRSAENAEKKAAVTSDAAVKAKVAYLMKNMRVL